MEQNSTKKEQQNSNVSKSLFEGIVATFGYSCIVFIFIVVTLSAFLSPVIEKRVSEKVDAARLSIKNEYASMRDVSTEYIHFRLENDQYYVWASNGEEILVTSMKLQDMLSRTGILSDDKVSSPGEVIAFAFAGAGVLIYLAFALVQRRKEDKTLERNNLMITATKLAVISNYTENKRHRSLP